MAMTSAEFVRANRLVPFGSSTADPSPTDLSARLGHLSDRVVAGAVTDLRAFEALIEQLEALAGVEPNGRPAPEGSRATAFADRTGVPYDPERVARLQAQARVDYRNRRARPRPTGPSLEERLAMAGRATGGA